MNTINALAGQIINDNPDRIEEIKNWTDEDINKQVIMYEEANKSENGKPIFNSEFLKETLITARKIVNN